MEKIHANMCFDVVLLLQTYNGLFTNSFLCAPNIIILRNKVSKAMVLATLGMGKAILGMYFVDFSSAADTGPRQ